MDSLSIQKASHLCNGIIPVTIQHLVDKADNACSSLLFGQLTNIKAYQRIPIVICSNDWFIQREMGQYRVDIDPNTRYVVDITGYINFREDHSIKDGKGYWNITTSSNIKDILKINFDARVVNVYVLK